MGKSESKIQHRQHMQKLLKNAAYIVQVPAYRDRVIDLGRWKASSEDEKLKSLLEQVAILVKLPTCKDLISFRHLMSKSIEQLTSGTKSIYNIKVNRSTVFEYAMEFFKNISEKQHINLQVTFEGEDGLDAGGLTKEFYSAFFRECLIGKHDLFEGTDRKLIPSRNRVALEKKMFFSLGRAIVSSILDKGAGFPYLDKYVFLYLTDKSYSECLNGTKILDEVIADLIYKIEEAKTNKELVDVISQENAVMLDHIGWPRATAITMANKDEYKKRILQWHLIDNRRESLDQLKEGLNHLGFLSKVLFDNGLEPLLVYSANYSVSADYVKQLFIPAIENLKVDDDKAKRSTREYALECINRLTGEEASFLFEFVTSLIDPPLSEITIQAEFNRANESSKLPEARSCSNLLVIPLGNSSADELHQSFQTALYLGRTGHGRY